MGMAHRRSPHGDLSEIVEGMVLKAGKDAIRKKLLTSGQVKPGKTANTLDELSKLEELKQERLVIEMTNEISHTKQKQLRNGKSEIGKIAIFLKPLQKSAK